MFFDDEPLSDLDFLSGDEECLRDEKDSRVEAAGFRTLDGESKIDFWEVEVEEEDGDEVPVVVRLAAADD